MVHKRPLGHGYATRIGTDAIEATFPLTDDMAGWHITAADVDESGHFLTIRFEPNTTEENR